MRMTRGRFAAALAPIGLGAAAAIVVALLPVAAQAPNASASTARPAAAAALTAGARGASAKLPVLVDCLGKGQVKPARYVVACADGGIYYQGLSWSTWSSTAAYGTGTLWANDCIPYCAAGTFHHFPALLVLWRPKQAPGSSGVQYFTRLTSILPVRHCFTAQKKRICYAVTGTGPLSAPR
jgi:hypothetical protein